MGGGGGVQCPVDVVVVFRKVLIQTAVDVWVAI